MFFRDTSGTQATHVKKYYYWCTFGPYSDSDSDTFVICGYRKFVNFGAIY